MLKIQNLNAGYGPVQILWDVSLEVQKGEIVTVVGPNGAGKSTLLKTILGLTNRMKGQEGAERTVLLEGKDISRLAPEEMVKQGIALVPEGARVFPDMSVMDNLLMGSYISQARPGRQKNLQTVFTLFPHLKTRINQKAKTMSGGERQAVAVGRALMSGPKLLLMDEPSLGLHPLLVSQTFEAIKEINRQGTTILLVEQNVFFSLEISHRAYVLENGRVVMEGESKNLLDEDYIKKAYLAM